MASAPAVLMLLRHGAESIVVSEHQLEEAVVTLRERSGIETTPSGAAGFAGLLHVATQAELRRRYQLDNGSNVLLVILKDSLQSQRVLSQSFFRAATRMKNLDEEYTLHAIGHVRSTLRALAEAPKQGYEGAPDAWIEISPAYGMGLLEIVPGDQVFVITWLHMANRALLRVHPRDNRELQPAGVFATRSPHRPNPLGLHRVVVREVSECRLRVGPMEVIDGTPVVDIKPVLDHDGGA